MFCGSKPQTESLKLLAVYALCSHRYVNPKQSSQPGGSADKEERSTLRKKAIAGSHKAKRAKLQATPL